MTLVDYSSSNEESIIKARVVNLNFMSLKFMLNESSTSDEENSILIAKDVLNCFLDMSDQFKNSITMNESSKKKSSIMNLTIEDSSMNSSLDEDVIDDEIKKESRDIIDDEIMKESRDIIDDEIMKESRDIIDDEIMKESQIRKKRLNLKNLFEKFRKLLEKQALVKIQSSRDDQEVRVKVNNKSYHVEYIIKYLHSCARFFIHDSEINLHISESSKKSLKSRFKLDLIRIFCELLKNDVENKI